MSRRAERQDQRVRFDELRAVRKLSGQGMAAVDWLDWCSQRSRLALVEVISAPFVRKSEAEDRLLRKFRDSLHALACVRAASPWGLDCRQELADVFSTVSPSLLVVVQLSGEPPVDHSAALAQSLAFVLPLHGLKPTAVAVLTRQLAADEGLPFAAP